LSTKVREVSRCMIVGAEDIVAEDIVADGVVVRGAE
jgi:hypothetical protein